MAGKIDEAPVVHRYEKDYTIIELDETTIRAGTVMDQLVGYIKDHLRFKMSPPTFGEHYQATPRLSGGFPVKSSDKK